MTGGAIVGCLGFFVSGFAVNVPMIVAFTGGVAGTNLLFPAKNKTSADSVINRLFLTGRGCVSDSILEHSVGLTGRQSIAIMGERL